MTITRARGTAAVVGLSMSLLGLVPAGAASAGVDAGSSDSGLVVAAETDGGTPTFLSGPIALLADSGITLDRGVTVEGGATIVRRPDGGDYPPSATALLTVGRDSRLGSVAADTVSLGRGTTVADLATNSTDPGGTVTGEATSVAVPIGVPYPAPAPATAGADPVDVARGMTLELAPGAYGDVTVSRESTLTLSGGDYVFASLSLDRDAELLSGDPTTVTITGRASIGRNSVVGDINAESMNLALTVLTADEGQDAPAITVDRDVALGATLAAPVGTLSVARNVRLVGSLTAAWLQVGRDVTLTYRAPLVASLTAPPGTVEVDGPDGLQLEIESGGGLNAWDVRVARDEFLTEQVADSLVSPVYDIDLPDDAAVTSAQLTIPYLADRVGSFPESDLRIYHHDDDLGLWVALEGEQVVDTENDTVSVGVDGFSAYAVFKLGSDGFERYWATKEVFCLQEGEAEDVGVDVAFVVDTSGSMASSDPGAMRVAGSEAFLDQMRPDDRAAVVGFSGSAYTLQPLTPLNTDADVAAVRDALSATSRASGGTSISAAVQAGLSALTGETAVGRVRVMILLTDGQSSYSTWLTDAARDDGVVIHTIGLGSGVDAALLESIASGTGGAYMHLADPAQLPSLYLELGRGIIDDGTDSDADGLTDCEETYGVLTSYGFYDVSLDGGQNNPFLGNRRVASDPSMADTDGDGLTDGEEVRGRGMGEPLDLRDYAALRSTYGFLIDAGITKYFIGYSLPTETDSDRDTVSDFDETNGLTVAGGQHYTSRADRRDTDFDLNTDDVEYRLGTNPREPDASELGIAGLDPYTTLFQPALYGTSTPVINGHHAYFRGLTRFLEFTSTVQFDEDWNCTDNCSALLGAAAQVEGSACWVPFFGSNCTTEEKVRTLVRQSVESQQIFTRTGDFTGSFANQEAAVQCVANNVDRSACLDPAMYSGTPSSIPLDDAELSDGPPNDNLDAVIAEVLLNVAGGYRPKNQCQAALGGVYVLLDAAGQIVYVGQTNDFERRRLEHQRDARLSGYDFRERYQISDYQTRRGMEQRVFNDTWGDVDVRTAQAQGSLNRQRPMSFKNPALQSRLDLARGFLRQCT